MNAFGATLTVSSAKMQRIWALARLVRPLNIVMIVAGVALGGLLSGGLGAWQGEEGERLLLAVLSAACIGAAANSFNDVFDLDIDRVNRPGRPLPAGLVSAAAARLIAVVASVTGVALGGAVSILHGGLALGTVGLLYMYNVRLKSTVLVGNVTVAFVIGLALVYGGWAVGAPGPALVGAGFAFLTTLAREIIKDVEDVEGDAAAGARTLPVAYGVSMAMQCTVAVLLVTLLLTPLPFFLLGYRGLFLILMLGVDALLLWTLWLFWSPQPERHARRISQMLKAVMLAGMIALAFGAVVQIGE
ncbi:MAG: geranylgeranylglycerol-phosphate geranylgeranyltransferase [Rhodothermales bacterium]